MTAIAHETKKREREKMKKNRILLISLIIALATLTFLTVNAKNNPDIQGAAFGTITNYKTEPDLPAKIVSGIWDLRIEEGKVWYCARVYEQNLDPEVENAPMDSIDILEYTFLGSPMVLTREDGVLTIEFYVQVEKTAAQWDGSYKHEQWKSHEAIILHDDGYFLVMNHPTDNTWYKEGTVLSETFFTP